MSKAKWNLGHGGYGQKFKLKSIRKDTAWDSGFDSEGNFYENHEEYYRVTLEDWDGERLVFDVSPCEAELLFSPKLIESAEQ